MKKLTLSLTSLVVAVAAFAQGTVNFGNIGTGTAISNYLTLTAVSSGTTFRASLYYLPDQATAPTTADFDRGTILLPDTGSWALAGQFAAGTRTTPASTPPAGFAWFQIRAWEVAFGNSYQAAVNNGTEIGGRLALVGTSSAVRVKTGDPVNNIPPGSLVGAGFRGFYVVPVPEPSVIGLGILGVGALLALRRRK